MVIKFVVYGEPVAQGRAKATLIPGKKGSDDAGHIRMYDPAKSRHYKEYVRAEALKVRPAVPLSGPLNVAVRVYRPIPKSMQTKHTRRLALDGLIRPVTRPDLSNFIKGIEDALNGILWEDDSRIVSFDGSGKWYSDVPRIEVEVKSLAPNLSGAWGGQNGQGGMNHPMDKS